MRRSVNLALTITFLFTCLNVYGGSQIREPAVSGIFYSSDKKTLQQNIDNYLNQAKPSKIRNLKALVSPHAGFRFSGLTAAYGYKLLESKKIDTVIILAPSHFANFVGASIPSVKAYRTPLGLVPLSSKIKTLAKSEGISIAPKAQVQRPAWAAKTAAGKQSPAQDTPHTWEHSLEVQLPFLQRTLKKFSIIPIVMGRADPVVVAKAIDKILDDKTIIIASSDLSHYHDYEKAKKLDNSSVAAICSLSLAKTVDKEACGRLPVMTLMHLAIKRGWHTQLLDYRNSGDTAGDKSRVVGYASIAFHKDKVAKLNNYSSKERKLLLNLATKTLTAAVNGKKFVADEKKIPAKLKKERATFVTLTKHGNLRGCIGTILPQESLFKSVISRTKAAALHDRRFSPVKPSELKDIELEISVLTIPKELEYNTAEELLQKLRQNVDGVVLSSGNRSATYLPLVWKQIPDKAEFLSHLARKAGLSPDIWRIQKVKIMVYQTEEFTH